MGAVLGMPLTTLFGYTSILIWFMLQRAVANQELVMPCIQNINIKHIKLTRSSNVNGEGRQHVIALSLQNLEAKWGWCLDRRP